MSHSSTPTTADHSTHLDYFDVAIVGSNILATGVAREATLRGLKTIIINSEDFASNLTESAGETTLGVERYQGNHDLSLTWEEARERKILKEICPQLVKDIPFLVPLTKAERTPQYRKKIGIAFYDLFAGIKSKQQFAELKGPELLKQLPGLDSVTYPHSLLFYDCHLANNRFTITSLLDAYDNHSKQYNYWKIEKIEDFLSNIKIYLLDTITEKRREITAKLIINLAGPAANSYLQKWDLPVSDEQKVIRSQQFFIPTLSSQYGIILPNPISKQLIYAMPWENYTLVSQTSTEIYHDFASPKVSKKFIETALSALNQLFPRKKLTIADVQGPVASLKAYLPQEKASIVINKFGQSNIITVYGGKYGNFRKLGQEIIQKAITLIGKKFGPSISSTARLRGSQYNEDSFNSFVGHRLISNFAIQQLPIDVAMKILNMYGTEVNQFEFVPFLEKPQAKERICQGSSIIWAQFYFSVSNEFVRKPSDFALRRSCLFLDLLKQQTFLDSYFKQAGEYLHLTQAQIEEDKQQFLACFTTTD